MPRFRSTGREVAFSLIEITLALGITSFTLISLLGLMAVATNAEKEARIDTTLGMIVTQSLSRFTDGGLYSELSSGMEYYKYDGTLATKTADYYFECQIFVDAPSLGTPELLLKAKQITFKINWPYAAPSPNQQIFTTTLAEY